MFKLLLTEDQLDDFITESDVLTDVGNYLQTLVENDTERIVRKRVVCLIELHRRHILDVYHIDERLEIPNPLLYFEAIHENVENFITRKVLPHDFLEECERIRYVMTTLYENKDENVIREYVEMKAFAESSRSGILHGFDAQFTRLVGSAFAARRRTPHADKRPQSLGTDPYDTNHATSTYTATERSRTP